MLAHRVQAPQVVELMYLVELPHEDMAAKDVDPPPHHSGSVESACCRPHWAPFWRKPRFLLPLQDRQVVESLFFAVDASMNDLHGRYSAV
jgi:hypothetical protein